LVSLTDTVGWLIVGEGRKNGRFARLAQFWPLSTLPCSKCNAMFLKLNLLSSAGQGSEGNYWPDQERKGYSIPKPSHVCTRHPLIMNSVPSAKGRCGTKNPLARRLWYLLLKKRHYRYVSDMLSFLSVKLGISCQGQNVNWGCLKKGWYGTYLALRGKKWRGNW
jgi:hypothetical protein